MPLGLIRLADSMDPAMYGSVSDFTPQTSDGPPHLDDWLAKTHQVYQMPVSAPAANGLSGPDDEELEEMRRQNLARAQRLAAQPSAQSAPAVPGRLPYIYGTYSSDPESAEYYRQPGGGYVVEITGADGAAPVPAPTAQPAPSNAASTNLARSSADPKPSSDVDVMGQPLDGPSDYNAWRQLGKIWHGDGDVSDKLGQSWTWFNYEVPDAQQKRQAYIDRINAENARWATIDNLRNSGLAGLLVTGGHAAGASPETIDKLAQTGAVFEGIGGSLGPGYKQTLTATSPRRVAAAS